MFLPTRKSLEIGRTFRLKDLTPQSLVSGYLDNFDPDYVVPLGECSDYTFDVGNRRTIHDVSDILAPVEEYGIPRYGIGLFEVLNYFINRELKFLRRDPLDLCVPCFGSKYRTFLASVFGTLSENINQIFWERFAGVLEAKKNECSDANYAEFLNARKLFFASYLRVTILGLFVADGVGSSAFSFLMQPIRLISWITGICVPLDGT